jgi:hypothetical protein
MRPGVLLHKPVIVYEIINFKQLHDIRNPLDLLSKMHISAQPLRIGGHHPRSLKKLGCSVAERGKSRMRSGREEKPLNGVE